MSTTKNPKLPLKIVICGNIGVGKTTAVRNLSQKIKNSLAIYEKFEENRYLP
jgi:deoxyadenosine/deoxycytidine kinase